MHNFNHICMTGREELKKEAEMLKKQLRALKKSEEKPEREDMSPTKDGNTRVMISWS